MAWIYDITTADGTLTQEQRNNNAVEFYNYFRTSMTLEAICGILGNITRESELNPGKMENGHGGSLSYGYGLIQWTPGSLLRDWANTKSYNWYDGNAQCEYINEENYYTDPSIAVWLPSQIYSQYNYTWDQYKQLTDVALATRVYFYQRERGGDSPSDVENLRVAPAQQWYNYLSGISPFVPRTTDAGMQGNPWWYSSGNIFYPNFGLPNCTCYAYGRWGEIRNEFANLPGGDAGTWYNSVTGFEKGQTPKLGAIACYHDPNGVRPGHVSVVEAIENGNISTSNSGWGGPYFWYAENLTPASGYRENWIISYGYVLQGFIYIDREFGPGPGPTPLTTHKMPLWMMIKHLH